MTDDVVANRRLDASENHELMAMARMGSGAFGYTADLQIDRGFAQLLRLRVGSGPGPSTGATCTCNDDASRKLSHVRTANKELLHDHDLSAREQDAVAGLRDRLAQL